MNDVLDTETTQTIAAKGVFNLAHLQHALEIVTPAIAKCSDMLPILRSIRIEQKPEGLAIEATDLILSIRVLAAETCGLSGPVIIPAEKFANWVKLLSGEDLKLSVNKRRATMHCGSARGAFPVLDTKSWPLNDRFGACETAITLKQSTLARALRFALIAISKEESRYTLSGALIVGDGKRITLVATDGHCMMVYTFPSEAKINTLLPLQFVKALLPLIADGTGTMTLGSEDPLILATIASEMTINLSCSKLQGSFPNWRAVIPDKTSWGRREVRLDAGNLLLCLERCILFSKGDCHAVKLTFGDMEVVLESSDPQSGESRESLGYVDHPAETFSDFRIGINADYLVRLLRKLDGELLIELPESNQSALLFRAAPAEGETLEYVIMPMRIEA
jgi:DNA polymerase III subunit beta